MKKYIIVVAILLPFLGFSQKQYNISRLNPQNAEVIEYNLVENQSQKIKRDISSKQVLVIKCYKKKPGRYMVIADAMAGTLFYSFIFDVDSNGKVVELFQSWDSQPHIDSIIFEK